MAAAVEFPDDSGNIVTFTVTRGTTCILTAGPTAHYLVENYDGPVTFNHLTHTVSDGIREFQCGCSEEDLQELLKALRELLGDQFEEYNRDLGFVETSDGEIILVSDASALMTEDEISFCSDRDEPATADEFSFCSEESTPRMFAYDPAQRAPASSATATSTQSDCEVVGCQINCAAGNLLRTPQKDGEKICEKEAYCIGVLHAETPIDVDLLLQNKGKDAWPANTHLTCVAGSGFGVPEMKLDRVAPGEMISLSMKGLGKEQLAESYWSLTDGLRLFGPLLYMTQI
mmetsp:Transcript_7224/g.17509  ORF Transcript_7224/g.17509 Transcript_7224/m.17509 type:complete len:287 (+) Transcript_7224:286-1146(+)|eukprot:CAMPEP_0178991148 /NCGR_PEP_ID=MMETSP0795-20121207/5359_1 /TAXON_ID=88552 /ORGANISM="Amoebophrya sp., Strain Ameob2" /LENGTH=286 /DNA_ID=CAMNT_0020682809 /DNA_START=287 /DNA_END=1147 /DNA_ORIENTATION=-